jgi:N-ethylmaleimide reductase
MKTETKEAILFEPVNLQGLNLKNRIVMAPMTRCRAIGNVPNDLMIKYYEQRASAGLIITEGTSPSPNGIGYARTPGIFTEQQITAWKKITQAVHAKGGKIVVQLMHVGRVAHPANMLPNAKILAPSPIASKGQMWTDLLGMQPEAVPNEMTTEEVKQTIQEFVTAAKNAVESGFDGIELHGANGYLIEQFINPTTNQRTDEYGGSIEKRCQFLIEITQGVIAAIGKEKVGIRISPYSTFNDMGVYEETAATYEYLTKKLNDLGILYLHIMEIAAKHTPGGNDLIAKIRNIYKGTLILAGGYTKETAERALTEKKADLIGFGNKFISNPDLVERLKTNEDLMEANQNHFYSAGEEGYIDYPFVK